MRMRHSPHGKRNSSPWAFAVAASFLHPEKQLFSLGVDGYSHAPDSYAQCG